MELSPELVGYTLTICIVVFLGYNVVSRINRNKDDSDGGGGGGSDGKNRPK